MMSSKKSTTRQGGYPSMSDKEFARFSALVYETCGIRMPPAKKTMLCCRLGKRMRLLNIHSFNEYFDYVTSQSNRENELPQMVDAVTTNKTDFMREPGHFDFLCRRVLPELIDRARRNGVKKRFKFWSAGCSTGEEPYTLAMVLADFASQRTGVRFDILATDVCTKVLERAALGVYDHKLVEPVPMKLRQKYMMRGKGDKKELIRMIPGIRELIHFQRLNFMDRQYEINETMDVIFCRNVLIYFDRPTQEAVLRKLCRYLQPGGYLFLGHSETIQGLNVPEVQLVQSTTYRKVP